MRSDVAAWRGGLEPPARSGDAFLIAAWWLAVAGLGTLMTVFSHDFLPGKFSYDAAVIRDQLAARDLWDGWSSDGFVNSSRFWWLVFHVVPEGLAIPANYFLLAVLAMKLLGVFEVRELRYHLLAGGWVLCSSLFLSLPSKEIIAVPVALWLCLARSPASRLGATVLFLVYAAFFRQYWAICFFYFEAAMFAMRLHLRGRSKLALLVMLAAYALPFFAAAALGADPLTDARTTVNADRVDSPDARSAFDNPFETTGPATDFANAVVSWFYMNVPVALLSKSEPHYLFFAAFQLLSLWFFGAGLAGFLRDAKRIGHIGTVYLRCSAFVIAYSLTQSAFEPDFGSFLRHEIVFMIPMLVVAFYRAHALRAPDPTAALRATRLSMRASG